MQATVALPSNEHISNYTNGKRFGFKHSNTSIINKGSINDNQKGKNNKSAKVMRAVEFIDNSNSSNMSS